MKKNRNKDYLECCSGNRNRNIFPGPSKFNILQGIPNNQHVNSIDPVLGGCEYLLWRGGQGVTGFVPFENPPISQGTLKSNGKITSGGGSDGILYLNQTAQNNGFYTTPYLPFSNENRPDINNPNSYLWPDPKDSEFYNGYRITIGQTGGQTGESRIITSYNMKEGSVSINTSFTQDEIVANTSYYISDPSDYQNIHIPFVDHRGNRISKYEQAYDNFFIIDETLSTDTNIVYADIYSYDNITHMARVDAISPSWKNSWRPDDILSLSKDFYIAKYQCMTGTTGSIPYRPKIVNGVYQQGSPITIDGFKFTEPIGQGFIYLPPYLRYGTGFFVGEFFVNTGIMGLTTDSQGYIEYQLLNPFVQSANSVYYCTEYSGYPENKITYQTIMGNPINFLPPVYNIFGGTNPFEIFSDIIKWVPFLYNNFQPLRYNGSIVSQNESVAYEVSCISLTLPNVILATGSRIALQYPYVYVQLSPITSSGSCSQNLIYSNNPQSNIALFTVPLINTPDPLLSQFIKVDGGQMTQTIKTKPNEDWAFSVFLPNGDLFIPATRDEQVRYSQFSPFPSNPLLQIQAVFSFKRI